jgi:TolA-binding protein
MPKFQRDKSGAVIISYSDRELEEHVGYRVLKLEERVKELERRVEELEGVLREVTEIVLYLKMEKEESK